MSSILISGGGARFLTEAGPIAGSELFATASPARDIFSQSQNYAMHVNSIAIKLVDCVNYDLKLIIIVLYAMRIRRPITL